MSGFFTSEQSQTTSTKVPKNVQAALDQMIGQSTGYAGQDFQEVGFDPIAGLAPEELESFGIARGTVGQETGISQAARGALEANLQRLNQGAPTLQDLEGFMNPYAQHAKERAFEDFDKAMSSQVSRFNLGSGTSGRGGIRGDIMRGEMAQGLFRNLSSIDAANYNQALQAYESRLRDAPGIAGSSLDAARRSKNLGLLDAATIQNIGGIKRGQEQRGLDFQLSEFFREEQDPMRKAGFLAGQMAQFPYGILTRTTSQEQKTSPFSALMGAGMIAAGAATGNPGVAAAGAKEAISGGGGGAAPPPGSAGGAGNFGNLAGSGKPGFAQGGSVGSNKAKDLGEYFDPGVEEDEDTKDKSSLDKLFGQEGMLSLLFGLGAPAISGLASGDMSSMGAGLLGGLPGLIAQGIDFEEGGLVRKYQEGGEITGPFVPFVDDEGMRPPRAPTPSFAALEPFGKAMREVQSKATEAGSIGAAAGTPREHIIPTASSTPSDFKDVLGNMAPMKLDISKSKSPLRQLLGDRDTEEDRIVEDIKGIEEEQEQEDQSTWMDRINNPLVKAGFSMLASAGKSPAQALGEAGMLALDSYQAQKDQKYQRRMAERKQRAEEALMAARIQDYIQSPIVKRQIAGASEMFKNKRAAINAITKLTEIGALRNEENPIQWAISQYSQIEGGGESQSTQSDKEAPRKTYSSRTGGFN